MEEPLETVEFLVRGREALPAAYLGSVSRVGAMKRGYQLPIRLKHMLAASRSSNHKAAVIGLYKNVPFSGFLCILKRRSNWSSLSCPLLSVVGLARRCVVGFIHSHEIAP